MLKAHSQLIVLLSCFLFACSSEYYAPAFIFKSKFNTKHVDDIDAYAKKLAKNTGYRVFEKSRSEMSAITNGSEAFYISYYIGDVGPIFVVTNAGVGNYISVHVYVDEGFDHKEAQKLSDRVKKDFKNLFDIELRPKVQGN